MAQAAGKMAATRGRRHRALRSAQAQRRGRTALTVKGAPLVAAFAISDAVEANIAIRAKMAQTSDIYGVAQMADGRMLFARKNVKVTVGSCG